MAESSIEIQDLQKMMASLIQSQQETAAQLRETDAQIKADLREISARFKETDARFKETDKRVKEAFDLFEGQWGKLIESLVEGDLVRILQERGVMIRDTSRRRKGSFQGTNYEFDIIAHNGNEIVVVEVKTTLYVKHIHMFSRKLEHIKTWLPEYKNFNIYGAVAFLRAEQQSEIYAERQRLFVIKATGKSASILNEANFVPKAF